MKRAYFFIYTYLETCCVLVHQVKAAFTRTYNKESHLTPYGATATAKKSSRLLAAESFSEEGEGAEEEEEEEESDMSQDPMVKPAKREAAASKGKGRGKTSSAGSQGGGGGKGQKSSREQGRGGKRRGLEKHARQLQDMS